ncbi:MAG: hypothetical protein RQ736_03845 [Thiogranum sp.]|nr:hypothetical protein [Thiogranum sp.]
MVNGLIRMYSRRQLSPFVGQIQIAEIDRARALSIDGLNWAVQYALTDAARQQKREALADPELHFTLVATIEYGELKPRPLHPFLDPRDVRAATHDLHKEVKEAELPFAAADRYEYWLLDDSGGRPLALLHSCVNQEDIELTPARPAWVAMPAAQLEVPAPEAAPQTYLPPVNYRLQALIEERAGARPRAVWFDRRDPVRQDFPPCLIRENWDTEQRQQLCDRYIRRLAPRLLMVQGLPQSVRWRLEQAARDYVFDVERFFPLYPEVVDRNLLTAARVEARLRRAAQVQV